MFVMGIGVATFSRKRGDSYEKERFINICSTYSYPFTIDYHLSNTLSNN